MTRIGVQQAGCTTVTIAVPTYRRPDRLGRLISDLQRSIAEVATEAPGEYSVDILVVDNDPSGTGRDVVVRNAGPNVRCVVEDRPGVSSVRNRAMIEASSSDLLVFIDDDELPQAGWLAQLLRVKRVTGATAVAGKVVPAYTRDPDPWIRAGGFFVRRSLPTGTTVEVAATNNLLLDLKAVNDLNVTFDPRYGLSGGEDSVFTTRLTQLGGRIVWCQEAVVADLVPVERLNRRWVLTRALSQGNTRGLIEIDNETQRQGKVWLRVRIVGKGLARVLGGAARLCYGKVIGSLKDNAQGLRTMYRGFGMMLAGWGLVFQEYSRTGTSWSRQRVLRFPPAPGAAGAKAAEQPLVALMSFPATPPKGNPYRVLLERSLSQVPGLRIKHFTWRTALTGKFDVFHVHWPEILVGGRTPLRTAIRQVLFCVLLIRLRVRRTPIVRTVHNLELPKDSTKIQALLLTAAERQTTLRIRINEATSLPDDQLHVTILHGYYREWFAQYYIPQTNPTKGRILFFGLIRRYKSVDALIRAFRRTENALPAATLRIVGEPSTELLRRQLTTLAEDDPRIELAFGFITDPELIAEIKAAQLVVMPYREMHNSAGVITAVSLERPVLVPDNPVNRAFAAEIGPYWIRMYSGELTGSHLAEVLRTLDEEPPPAGPNLDARDWSEAGAAHFAAYRAAATLSRRKSLS